MKKSLSFFLGIRFSYSFRQGSIVSLIGVLSILGIALSISVLIISLSVMNGFEYELNHRILAVVPHGEIESVNQTFSTWRSLLNVVEKVPGVVAAAPYVNSTGLIQNGRRVLAVQIKGIDAQLESRISAIPFYVQGLMWKHFVSGQKKVLIGQSAANSLNIKLGDWISLMITKSGSDNKILQKKKVALQVVGMFNLNGIYANNMVYIPLIDMQNLLEIGESITGIAIRVDHPFHAEQVVYQAGKRTGLYVAIRSWISTYGYMYHDIQMIRGLLYLAMVLIIGISCFNIMSTLVIAIKDKGSDIAILRTLGAKDELICSIFLWYGLLLGGLTGSIIGVVIGILVVVNLTSIFYIFEKVTGYHLLSGDIYFIDFIPSRLDWIDVIIILLTVVVLSLGSSWYPAQKAIRLCPARVLSEK
ncbi:lipoprotein-releasing ABC transporter permease subunit LolE [Candidatus Erwinia haradaeae]|uniref:Lipoprotein-releasing system transmembrane protein LolE n=1 Tax=Candidatus Erwinia haradaeae TaxID=1922217 RepID=A0A803FUB0_9GAMM|nr:lipoprotein-releasing ABC transporter permease subunit LolE [Candidatus Erwinia haradaeae]VFP88613.1 Lipoprotein-releasing system transmembrane protein LolE [Candidatus Erwinia haradaeae]